MWLKRHFSDLDRGAQEAWGQVLQDTGMDPKGWSQSRLSRRNDPHIAALSYLMAHPEAGRFTFKFQLRPASPDGFAAHYEMQSRAHADFPHSPSLTVPRPVHLDRERQASLMEYAEGRPLSDPMREAATDPQAQLDLLRRAGQWLDAFHRSAPTEPRQFQPKHTLRYYHGLREQIAKGDTKVAAKPIFLAGIDRLTTLAPEVEGQATVSARQHGDFHMRNLIWSGSQLAGIDISKSDAAHVGYDIAKMLLDYTAILRQAGDVASGDVVPRDALAAFFGGYTLVGSDDPGLRFLLYARILATLVHVPQRKEDRTEAKQRTLARLRPIARNAFGMG